MKERKVLCPACGAEMELKLERFSIGADGHGGLMSLLMEQYDVDLYACPKCGKVELYTADFDPEDEEEENEKEENEEEMKEEPEDEEQSEPKGGGIFGFGKRKDKRPPWEK